MLGMVESGSGCWARETEIACNVTEVCPSVPEKCALDPTRMIRGDNTACIAGD